MSTRNQAQDAQFLYDERAPRYDNSWHVRFTRHMSEKLDLQPGQHVLDLACGTGLMTYRESVAVGLNGSVTGVDISSGMLDEAESKRNSHEPHNVYLYRHSITELATLGALKGKRFDAITCISALVLLPDPEEAVRNWVSLLKPGGKFLVDATHPGSQLAGITLERVGNTLGRPVPSYRLRFQKPDDLRQILERAGLVDIEVQLVSQLSSHDGTDDLTGFLCDFDDPRIANVYNADDAEAIFMSREGDRFTSELFEADTKDRAAKLFKEEWRKLAKTNDSIDEVDGVYVAVGKKPQ